MKSDFHGLLSWPLVFAILFIAIPPLLFYSHPSSFWANTDYEPLGLADALNLAYRIADFRIYPAVGMADHPGVPFYLMSWLALALAGYPVASGGPGFFSAVIDHVEDYHQASVWLGALAGAAGVYILARTARPLAPVGVVAIGLLAWLISTPATLLMFTTPSIELFAILVNGLFFYALVRIAFDRDFSRSVTVLAASVSAFAYLNKLPYINVSLALAAAGICSLVFGGAGLALARQRCVLFTLSSLGIILAVGCLVIGWGEFLHLLRFHRSIVFNSGLYGTGDQFVVSGHDVWHAIAAIPRDSLCDADRADPWRRRCDWRVLHGTEGPTAHSGCDHRYRRRPCLAGFRDLCPQALRSSLHRWRLRNAAGECHRGLPAGELVGLSARNGGRRARHRSHPADGV